MATGTGTATNSFQRIVPVDDAFTHKIENFRGCSTFRLLPLLLLLLLLLAAARDEKTFTTEFASEIS